MKTIKNERLKVTFRYDPTRVFSQRFESIGVIEQVCLDGKYQFCEPEQRISKRQTCHGVGLCGEYVWDELAQEVSPGNLFPKLGVGLLIQRPEGGPYNMWKDYDVYPYPIYAEFGPDWAEFVQEPIPCNGIAARIIKQITLVQNEIHVKTTVENCGERKLDLNEYQHNFVSLNGCRTGPDCVLEVPFDGEIQNVTNASYPIENFQNKIGGYLEASSGVIRWKRFFHEMGFHKVTEKENLHLEKGAYWKLRHAKFPLMLTEELTFIPNRLVMWGVEHCICVEVYVGIQVVPGECQTWERIWRFSDE